MLSKNMKPLFDSEFVAFSPFDAAALAQLLKDNRPMIALEVGSWLGNGSTQVFLQHVPHVVCVDHFQGNPNVTRHQTINSRFDVFGTFLRNVAPFRDRVSVLQMDSSVAAALISDQSMDFVFIDGDHSYRQTQLDITNYLPKVKKGGVLGGHDCEGRLSLFGEAALSSSESLDTLEIPGHRIPVIHPGCIRAVSETFGDSMQLFADRLIDDGTGQLGYSSVWYVQC